MQPLSGVTDVRVSKRTVYRLMRGGRARWKIENETCNTLKNQGDHFAHTYGHGEQHLSVLFAMRRMLAFLVDQTQQRCGALCEAVRAKRGSTRLRWERMRALLYDEAFAAMRQLFEALFDGFNKSGPIVALASSSSPTPLLCHRDREAGHAALSWGSYAWRTTSSPYARALLLDLVVGNPASKPNGWPNGQKTVPLI